MQEKFQKNENAPLKISENFAQESALLRAAFQREQAEHSPVSLASRQAFSPVHARLMDAVESDAATRRDSSPSALPFEKLRMIRDWLAKIPSLGFAWRFPVARVALALFLLTAVGVGGHHFGSQQGARALPIQSIVDDFQTGENSPLPLDFVSSDTSDAKPAAHWLSTHVGHKVLLPSPGRSGTHIVGARRPELDGRAVAQAHYIHNGVRVALYQIHEPRAGLKGLQETQINGRTFLASQRGAYHVVVWRKGEDIVTMVSPLASGASLRLAAVLRDASPDV